MSNLSSFKPSNVSTSQPSRVAAAAAPKQEPDIYEFLDDFSEDDDDVPTINIIKPPSQAQIPPKFQLEPFKKSTSSISSAPRPAASRSASRQSLASSGSYTRKPAAPPKRPSSQTRHTSPPKTQSLKSNDNESRRNNPPPIVIYKRVQTALVFSCLLLTLIQLGLAIWLNLDPQFRFLARISNSLPYSSLDRLFGMYPLAALSLSSLALLLDIVQYGQFLFIMSYLNIKQRERLTRYRYIRLQQLIMYIKTYTLMTHLFYIFIVITLQLFIASYLMANFHLILNYQIPQTLVKLLREFDKKTSEKEVELVSIMHRTFSCCHYQTPYQFGDLKPSECDQNQGCLRPIQEFTWVYLYVSIIVAIVLGVLKFAIQILLLLNFYWLLLKRIIRNINDQKQIELVNLPIDSDHSDSDSSWDDKKSEGDRRLAEIRRAKEQQLELEEREEEEKRIREMEEQARKAEFEKRQDEYELMLFQQKRYDELRVEQMNRRLQQQIQNN